MPECIIYFKFIGQKLQVVIKKVARINAAFETEMEGRENVMKEVFVFLKAFSISALGVCLLPLVITITL